MSQKTRARLNRDDWDAHEREMLLRADLGLQRVGDWYICSIQHAQLLDKMHFFYRVRVPDHPIMTFSAVTKTACGAQVALTDLSIDGMDRALVCESCWRIVLERGL